MKKYLIILLFPLLFCSQSHRFVYDFSYKSHPKSESLEKETYYLDIINDDVIYMSSEIAWADSVNRHNPNGKTMVSSSYPQIKTTKNSTKYSTYYVVNNDYYVYESDDPIQWNLTSVTKKEGDLSLQMATADFGGRKWTAWFSQTIPFNEGPYKFRGLPGLVVEVSDNEGNFVFKLSGKIPPKEANPNILEKVFLQKPIPITWQKLNEVFLNDYNNPYQQYRNLKPGSWSLIFADGRNITTIEELNGMKKEHQQEILNNYNPIELDKAIPYLSK